MMCLGDRTIVALEMLIDRLVYTWWRHQMETFSALLAICAGNSPSFDVFYDLRLNKRIKGWVNNGEAGDLRRHRAHYDVIVMMARYANASMMSGRLPLAKGQ